MIEKIFDLIKDNFKNRKFISAIIIVFLIVMVLFPYIDANYFYYNRVEQRISILKQMAELDIESFDSKPILLQEYNSILEEINNQKDVSLGNIIGQNNTKEVARGKFISGAILSWLLGIFCLFVKMNKTSEKIIGFFGLLLIGSIAGVISVCIPTIKNPIFNYIFIPIIQLVLVVLWSTSKKETDNIQI